LVTEFWSYPAAQTATLFSVDLALVQRASDSPGKEVLRKLDFTTETKLLGNPGVHFKHKHKHSGLYQ
jgi:hypothetical protein